MLRLPKEMQRWINFLFIIFLAMSISAYTGLVLPFIWYSVLIPLTVLWVIASLSMTLKLIVVNDALMYLEALDGLGLYQMERE